MDFSELRLQTNRILAGKIYYDGRIYNLPSIDYEAELLYNQFFDEAVFSGVLTNDDLYRMSNKKPVDTIIIEKSEEIKKTKLDLFNNRNSNQVQHFKNRLIILDQELTELIKEKNIYYNYSAEYVASYIRDLTLLSRCNTNISKAYLAFANHSCPEKVIRSVARSGYFFELFNSGGLRIFPKLMTEEQRALIGWFKKYKNIYNHHEKPEDWVIEYDDMLDGWLMTLQKEEKKPPTKIPEAKGQEVFVFAKPQRTWNENTQSWIPGVDEVYDQNSLEARVIIKGRQNKISKEGKMDQFDLPDVRKDFAGMIVRGE